MGCASSNASPASETEKAQNAIVDQSIKEDAAKEKKIFKLLLLGAGSSGKSTFLKQMIEIYGGGFDEAARTFYIPIIFTNIIHAMKLLISNSSKYGEILEPNKNSMDKILNFRFSDDQPIIINEEIIGPDIIVLWNDPTIKKTFLHGANFHLPESCKYFFDRMSEIMKFGYLPTTQDILRIRAPTNGIVETSFNVEENIFKMFDVGGQRNQRKKWIHCFDNVTAVLFVAAISEYNQALFEDERTNRLVEALTLFGEVCNAKWFRKTALILFLNKCDLFREKLSLFPFHDHFPDYDGENQYELVVAYIDSLFRDQNENEKKIFVHTTCATDTLMVKNVFNDVQKIVVNKSLQGFGLV